MTTRAFAIMMIVNLALVWAQATPDARRSAVEQVGVIVRDGSGQRVGWAALSAAEPDGVKLVLHIERLPPGLHAFHVHQKAECDAETNFNGAGLQYDPLGSPPTDAGHAHMTAGDPGAMVEVAADGTGHTTAILPSLTLGDDARSVFANGGTAIVIHAASGAAGPTRIGCGVISRIRQSTGGARVSRVPLTPCTLPNVADARCGTYEVYENRAMGSGRKVPINLVVLPAVSPARAPDPLFWIEGGPGLGGTGSAGFARIWLAGVQKTRDIVFVDQRGTGKSNPLVCDVGDTPEDLQKFFGAAPLVDRARACRAAVEPRADLRQYTTPVAMDDLDDLRAALGYDRINVAGISYGAMAAQVYLRQHGDRVRTASLIDIVTPDFRLPLGFPRSNQHALDRLFEDCAADATCHGAFPNLKVEFGAVLTRFENDHLPVTMIRPSDKQVQSISLSHDSFMLRVTYLLANTDTARLLPFIIHRAFENDFVPFETAAILLNPASRVARGMYFSVTCSESVPFITEADIQRETVGTAAGDHPVREQVAACRDWPLGQIAATFTTPVASAVPVLILNGDADPLSGPWFGAEAIKSLPNGRLVEIRDFAHQFGDPCTRSIVATFIEQGASVGLDTSCTADIHRPPFATELPPSFVIR